MKEINMPKYPCKNCVYFIACGENSRTMPCYGRKTNKDAKKEKSGRYYDKVGSCMS